MMKQLLWILLMWGSMDAGAALLADYNFNGNLTGSLGDAPDVEVVDGSPVYANESPFGFDTQVLLNNEVEGIRLPLNQWDLDKVFSVVMYVRIDDVNGYRKMADFNERGGDSGLYINNGGLEFVQPNASGPSTWVAGQYTQMVLTRDATDQIRVYQDGVLVLDVQDTPLVADLNNTAEFYFLVDDFSTDTENPSGAIARLMIFDETLDQSQIDELGIIDLIFADDFED